MLPVCEMLNYAAPCDLSTVSCATDKSTFTKSIYTLAFLCLKPEFFFFFVWSMSNPAFRRLTAALSCCHTVNFTQKYSRLQSQHCCVSAVFPTGLDRHPQMIIIEDFPQLNLHLKFYIFLLNTFLEKDQLFYCKNWMFANCKTGS